MPARAGTELHLADLIASLSLATDLGMGWPMEHVACTADVQEASVWATVG